ncbi:MAG: right-handed parallel beta-helix repeat-containing protein [Anaerolineales bacterium]|nr:right-handed parallel beta-helix repeat-containing protein [Anaerolineales bacterium]
MDTPTISQAFSHTAIDNKIAAPGASPSGTAGAVRSRGRLCAMMVVTPLALLFLLWAPVALAVEDSDCMHLVVTNTADAGLGSLRQALYEVCAGGRITFAPELTAGGPATITLTSGQLTLPASRWPLKAPAPRSWRSAGTMRTASSMLRKASSQKFPGWRSEMGSALSLLLPMAASPNERNSAFSVVTAASHPTHGGGAIFSAGFLTRSASGISQEVEMSGGGLYNEGHLTIRDSVIVSNSAGYGGGIYNTGALTIEKTTIMRNLSGYGGGIQNDGYRGKGANLYVVDSVVMENLADTGSGIDNLSAAAFVKSTTIISNGICQGWNCGTYGGGVSNGGGSFTLADSVVRGNAIADGYGAGIFSSGALTVTNTIVDNNGDREGAGIALWNGTARIEHSTISNNRTDFNGGGICIGFWGQNPSLEINDSTIIGNDAGTGMGGGIMAYENANVTIRRTAIVSNTAVIGGGIMNDGAITVVKSTIVSNTAFDGGGIYNDGAVTVVESTVQDQFGRR